MFVLSDKKTRPPTTGGPSCSAAINFLCVYQDTECLHFLFFCLPKAFIWKHRAQCLHLTGSIPNYCLCFISTHQVNSVSDSVSASELRYCFTATHANSSIASGLASITTVFFFLVKAIQIVLPWVTMLLSINSVIHHTNSATTWVHYNLYPV